MASVVANLKKVSKIEAKRAEDIRKPKAETRTRKGILGLRKGLFQAGKRQESPIRKQRSQKRARARLKAMSAVWFFILLINLNLSVRPSFSLCY